MPRDASVGSAVLGVPFGTSLAEPSLQKSPPDPEVLKAPNVFVELNELQPCSVPFGD
jgi:hypothetical protein